MSEKQKRNESRYQARYMEKVRNNLDYMNNRFGANFAMVASFPNFEQYTVQEVAYGDGEEFLSNHRIGRHIGSE